MFSRGVKFKVDENNFTYEILDSYGEEFPEHHSPIISGIDFSQATAQDSQVLEESILTLLRLFTIELKE